MITNALIYLLYFALIGITLPLRIFSDVVAISSVTTAITSASGYISAFNGFFPMDTLIVIAQIFLNAEIVIAGYKIIKWIYQKIPFIN